MKENSIEEDIVLLKEMQQNCLTKKEYKDSKANKKAKAIEHILSDLKNVLSMLEVKDKQIDKLKKHNDDLLRKLRNRVNDVKKLQKYSLYKKEFSRLNKQLQNKDKQTDLMAEYISNITDCPFESEGKYIDCEKMCDVRTDKECWKQYFENQAKERR